MSFRCTYCGCTSSHYNSRRMRFECDMCGHGTEDEAAARQTAEYDRDVAMAQAHLAAGNWQMVINLLNPHMQSRPTDKSIYRLMLRAATRDYTDLEVNASAMKSTACNCWERLSRLGGIDGNMARYSARVWQAKKQALVKEKNKVYLRACLAAGSMLCAFSCLFANSYFAFLVLIFASICFAGSISDLKPRELNAKIALIPKSGISNPFV